MRLYVPIAKIDAEQRMVWGYASTEARDDQGEIIRRTALQAALPEYMRFANIREMHQMSAVGVAKEAAVDEHGLFLGAKVVDPAAWEKVREGVYKGFSIGGRVVERDPGDRSVITALALTEISLVDRPANPEAVFDCWKASGGMRMPDGGFGQLGELLQVWDCGAPGHRHLKKEEAASCVAKRGAAGPSIAAVAAGILKGGDRPGEGDKPFGDVAYADPGYQSDGKKRYPIDTEKRIRAAWSYIHKPKNREPYTAEQLKRIEGKIVAAWKDKIDPAGPPEAQDAAKALKAALRKHLLDAGPVADIIWRLDWLADQLDIEAAVEGDDSPAGGQARAVIAELCALLRTLVEEGTAEMMAGEEEGQLTAAAKAARGKLMHKRSEADQHLMDLARGAVDKALAMDGLEPEKRGHMVQAGEALRSADMAVPKIDPPGPGDSGQAGSADTHATQDTGHNPAHGAAGSAADPQVKPGADPTGKAAEAAVIDMIAQVLGKRGGHQHLMDVAHDCVAKMTDGAVCGAQKAARHPQAVMDHLHKAHFHLVAAGAAGCAEYAKPRTGGLPDEHQGAGAGNKLAGAADLAKALEPLAGQIAAIAADVAAIKATPLPALTARSAAGLTALDKAPDGGGAPAMTVEAAKAALAAMDPEERTLALIRAARSQPFRMRG